jgi:hypothetical protein
MTLAFGLVGGGLDGRGERGFGDNSMPLSRKRYASPDTMPFETPSAAAIWPRLWFGHSAIRVCICFLFQRRQGMFGDPGEVPAAGPE